jgi:hypothetical protein
MPFSEFQKAFFRGVVFFYDAFFFGPAGFAFLGRRLLPKLSREIFPFLVFLSPLPMCLSL